MAKYKKWLNRKMVAALKKSTSNVSIVDPDLNTEIAKKVSSIFGNTFYIYGQEIEENEFIKFINDGGKVFKWETF